MRTTILTCALVLATTSVPYGAQEQAAKERPQRPDAATLALFDYDRDGDLLIEDNGYTGFRGGSRIDLSYESPMGGRVPAYLYEPEGEGPFAGILFMHGMPGDRTNMAQVAREYAASGAVVLAISAPWARGERAAGEILRFTEDDRREQIQLIQDLRRGLDLLATWGTVDPERLAYVGGSYGGAMGGLLAGVEPRLKALALMVGDGGLVAHFTGADDGGHVPEGVDEAQWRAWLGAMRPIEPIRFVGLAQGKLLFQNGKLDELVPAADAREYHAAAPANKTVIWYEGGHAISGKVIRDQARWMAKHIGIDPAAFGVTSQ